MRIPNPHVGPQALRNSFRSTYRWSAVRGIPMGTLVDDFHLGADSKWVGQGANVVAQYGAIYVYHSAAPTTNILQSAVAYDLTESFASVQVLDFGHQNLASHEVNLALNVDGNNLMRMFASNNNLLAYKTVNGVQTQIGSGIALDQNAMRWFRIRESGGTTFFDTAPDGIAWTNRWSLSNPFAVTALSVGLQCDNWNTETIGSYAVFDNFNTLETSPYSYKPTKISNRNVGPAALRAWFRQLYVVPASIPAVPQTYYIAANGSNANNGLTSGAPWADLTNVNFDIASGKISTYNFRGGDTFTGKISLGNISGTSTTPITFDSYGTGKATLTNTSDSAILIYNQGGIVIKNLNITGGAGATSQTGIGAYCDLVSPVYAPDYVQILNCDISGWNRAIVMGGVNNNAGFSNVTIDGCVIHDNLRHGMETYGPTFAAGNYASTNFTIQNSIFHDNLGDPTDTLNQTGSGLMLASVSNAIIQFCTAYNNGANNAFTGGGPVGLWCYNSTGITFQHCLSYNNNSPSGVDGVGFDFDLNTSNSTIQYCLAYGNMGAGILIWGVSGSGNTGNVVAQNLLWGNSTANPHGQIHLGITSAATIYNNTIVAMQTGGVYMPCIDVEASVGSGTLIANNILYGPPSGNIIHTATAYANTAVKFLGNCYYQPSMSIDWGGTNYSTEAAWFTAQAQENLSGANVGIVGDPKLVNAITSPTVTSPTAIGSGADGMKLRVGSPASQTGISYVTLGIGSPITIDYWGNAGTSPPSVGAYESLGVNVIAPTGIDTSETAGAPAVNSSVLTVSPVGIGTTETVGSPNVTKVVSPAGIGSSEIVGASAVNATTAISPGGMASGETVAEPTVSATNTVAPAGIGSTETVGSPNVTKVVSSTGIGSLETVGASAVNATTTISPVGMASGETIAEPTVSATNTISPAGIGSSEIVGASAVNATNIVASAGISTAEIVGSPNVTKVVSPAGVTSGEVIGGPQVAAGAITVAPVGVGTGEVFGAPIVGQLTTILPTGIGSSDTIGEPTVGATNTVAPAAIGAAETAGALNVTQIVSPTGASPGEASGASTVAVGVSPTSVGTGALFGNLQLTQVISPTSIGSTEQFGSAVVMPGAVTVSPGSVATEERFGTISASVGASVVNPTGIKTTEQFGSATVIATASIAPVGVDTGETVDSATLTQTIAPAGIGSGETDGAPTAAAAISPAGVASSAAFGNATPTQSVSPIGIVSGETSGAPTVAPGMVTMSPNSIVSVSVFGAVTAANALTPSGIPGIERFGSPMLSIFSGAQTVITAAILSEAIIGNAVVYFPPSTGRTLVVLPDPRIFIVPKDD